MQMKLEPRVLEGKHVRLEPLTETHREELRAALNCDPETWAIHTVSGYGDHYPDYWNMMVKMPNSIFYVARDRESSRCAGMTSFYNIEANHRTVEIGYTWYNPAFRGSVINPETKLLLLSTAFGAGARRVQFMVNEVNARSQAAVLKLGARKEGIHRNHRLLWNGENRDTAVFSIIDEEWPEVRERLTGRIGHAPAD